jgi:hypothetical protein
MKRLLPLGLLGVALVVTGCQQSTSTGPAGTTRSPSTQSRAPDGGVRTDPGTRADTGAKKLTLTAKEAQTVARGSTDKVQLTINRDNFNDPVTIKFSGLPKGVEVVEKDMTFKPDENMKVFTLQASGDAALGEHNVTITAEAPGLSNNTQTFKLTVK